MFKHSAAESNMAQPSPAATPGSRPKSLSFAKILSALKIAQFRIATA
jgi:hypothetical protein